MSPFSKWTTIGYAVAIFITGGISGGALGLYEGRTRPPAPPGEQEMAGRILDRLQVRLNLTPDQIARIRPIIARSAVELRLVRADTALRINKVFDDSYAQVSALLTADQRTKLDEMQRKRRENMQLHLGGRWRPGAGLGGPLRRGPGDDDGQSPAPATP